MAIYSIHLQSVGRTTHAEGTASAHLKYITRDGALPSIGAYAIPAQITHAQAWLNEQEQADRKNARVIDKIRIALPLELTSEQRYSLTTAYLDDMTQKKIPYFFAIHEIGNDANNPHAHIIIRDRDIETGKRFLCLSDSPRDWKKAGREQENPTEWVRERWEFHANKALQEAGHSVRIDRRSLAMQREEALEKGDIERARELDRKAQIHIGVKASQIESFKQKPDSKGKYQSIDKGKARSEHNADIIDFNLEKKIRSQDISTRTRALFEKEQLSKERELEKKHKATLSRQQAEERTTRIQHRKVLKDLADVRNQGVEKIQAELKECNQERVHALKQQHRQELDNLNHKQGRFFAHVGVFLDWTGKAKAKQAEARQELLNRHQKQEKEIDEEIERKQNIGREIAEKAYADRIQEALNAREQDLQGLQMKQTAENALMQEQLQAQETAREYARLVMEHVIQERERTAKEEAIKVKEQDNTPKRTAETSYLQERFKAVDQKEQERQQRQERAREIALQIQEARTAPPQQGIEQKQEMG